MASAQSDHFYHSEEVKEPPLITEDEEFSSNNEINRINETHSTLPSNKLDNFTNSKSISFRDAFKNIKTTKANNSAINSENQNLLDTDSFLKRDAKKAELTELNQNFFENPLKKQRFEDDHRPKVKFAVNSNVPAKKEENEKTLFLRREGDWICAECKNVNFSRRKKCNRCDKFKFGSEHLVEYEINEEDVDILYTILGKGNFL